MEILGVGMPELIFILIVALIIMGPKDMEKAGKTIGKFLRKVVTSDGWQMFQQTSREIRTLPNRLMREANEDLEQINQIGKDLNKPIAKPDTKFNPPARSLSTPPITTTSENPPAAEAQEKESDPKKDA